MLPVYTAIIYNNRLLYPFLPRIHAPTYTDINIHFDQSLYTVDESGSVAITLTLDGGIATSISVTIQPGMKLTYV